MEKHTTTITCEELDDNISIEILYEPADIDFKTGDTIDAVIEWIKCDDRQVDSDTVFKFFSLDELLENSEIEVNGSEFEKIRAAVK